MARPFSIKALPDASYLHELFLYDAQTGLLTWKFRPIDCFHDKGSRTASHLHKVWNSKFWGKQAGSVRRDGYATVMIDGVHYKLHRIIWKMVTGEDPQQIDHINRDQGDNRFENLRDVVPQVNARNRGVLARNKTGFPGVEFHNRDRVWVAKLGHDGKQIYLGSFKTKDEAIAARVGAEVTRDTIEARANPLTL